MHLEITLSLPCINNCAYCPQGKLKDKYTGDKIISFERFKKALENVPQEVEIHFSGFSEAFGHPDAHEIVRYAVESGYNVHVYTTTRGLQPEKLQDLKFGAFRIHNIGNLKDVPYKTHTDTITNPLSRGGNNWEIAEKKQPLKCKKTPDFDPMFPPTYE